jgi:tetratricopeptide (TPR) repeat protein
MFSINIYLRFALIAVFLIGGIAAAFIPSIGFWWGFPFLLIALILLAGYLLLGTVQSAALLLQATQFDEAEKRLGLTFFPKLLYVTNRAYFYILKGTLASAQQKSDEAEIWLKKAQTMKLPTDNEKAMIELQLANIAATKGKWQQAQNSFRNIKTLKVTDANIKEQMKQFEKALQQQGQVKATGMGNTNMMRPGGKRRRPKMR